MKSRSASRLASRRSCPWSSTRKNQFPPQATSPADRAVPRDLDGELLDRPVARDVADRHLVGTVQRRLDDADRRLDPVRPRPDLAQVGERHQQADRPVAAHPEVADVVEEDHPGGARRVGRLDQERPDHRVRPPRLVADGRPELIEPRAEGLLALGQAARPEVRPPRDHHTRRLAARVRVDHPRPDDTCNPIHRGEPFDRTCELGGSGRIIPHLRVTRLHRSREAARPAGGIRGRATVRSIDQASASAAIGVGGRWRRG